MFHIQRKNAVMPSGDHPADIRAMRRVWRHTAQALLYGAGLALFSVAVGALPPPGGIALALYSAAASLFGLELGGYLASRLYGPRPDWPHRLGQVWITAAAGLVLYIAWLVIRGDL